jgi:hypothetical protein
MTILVAVSHIDFKTEPVFKRLLQYRRPEWPPHRAVLYLAKKDEVDWRGNCKKKVLRNGSSTLLHILE